MEDLSDRLRSEIQNRINASNELSGDYEKDKSFQEFKPQEFNLGGKFQNDAITAKANANFLSPRIAEIQTMQKANYANQTQDVMKRAQTLGMGQLRYDNARAMAAANRRAQEEAQRAQYISGLFQGAGTIAGLALGGAGGAIAGNSVGGAVANGGNVAGGRGETGGMMVP